MLRIKKDVDLKELEKFGFTEHSEIYFNARYFTMVDKDTRKIHIINTSGDLLYDLIQAGLVEKVVE